MTRTWSGGVRVEPSGTTSGRLSRIRNEPVAAAARALCTLRPQWGRRFHRGEAIGRARSRARAPGPFEKKSSGGEKTERSLEGPDHVISWAVGHLVQLAEPDEYDDKFKKWRMADLPIVPDRFKLIVRDERSQKQMTVVSAAAPPRRHRSGHQRLRRRPRGRADLRLPLREGRGEAAGQAAVAVLDDRGRDARGAVAPARGEEMALLEAGGAVALRGRLDRRHERHPGRDHPAALELRRRGLARPRADPDAGDPHAARGGDPRVRPREVLAGRCRLRGVAASRRYEGRYHAGAQPRIPRPRRPRRSPRRSATARARSPSSTRPTRKERAPLLYDLTSLQREANNRYGFSARRTLGAAQRLYEEHKALTYPRTNSRYLPSDMVNEIKPIAGHVGRHPEYARRRRLRARASTCCRSRRVVDDAKVTDHHAIIPTNADHNLGKMGDDDRRIYDMVARRFLAVFHPEAVFENTRVETTVAEHVFRTRGKILVVPGWRGVYGELAEGDGTPTTRTRAATSSFPSWRRARRPRSATSRSSRRRPSRRGATATPRCSAPWRPRASSSTTTSCARR